MTTGGSAKPNATDSTKLNPLRCDLLPGGTQAEITEPFARRAFRGPAGKERREHLGDLRRAHALTVHAVEPGRSGIAAEIERVAIRTHADDPYFAHERARAAVRTAGHANGDRIGVQIETR